ncbi:MAG: superinfection exclusion B family protein [Proteobacteria bacterium]|uniref:Superinfection exclusion B family protein n=1 Tax=Candidatus Avisuccinivibrio stercorigallinarum TaxID=2840704 RepID=A0A9D9GSW5_9GAMM|nr:superinfection exclusion B family protein [Candidatus Avisuccinivibrio stercorigallinarum]
MNEREMSFFGQYRTLNIIMLWLFFITMMLLFVPFTDIAPVLAERVEENRQYLYIALIVCAANFAAQLISSFFMRLSSRHLQKRLDAQLKQSVSRLDFAERALLREFVLQRKSVLALPLDEPTVRSLVESGILKIMPLPPDENDKYKMAISKAARPYITYKAIGLSRGHMSEESISQIMAARPEYARVRAPMPRAYRGSRAA